MKKDYSLIDTRIKQLRRKYLTKVYFTFGFFFLFFGVLIFFYLSSKYLDMPYSEFIMTNLSFIYVDKFQWVINSLLISLSFILSILFTAIRYFVLNKKYLANFETIFVDELRLNEIYLIQKRNPYDGIKFETLYKYLSLNQSSHTYLYTFNVENIFSLYQIEYRENNKKHHGLLINLEGDFKIPHFYQISTENNSSQLIEYKDKEANIFYYQEKYLSKPIYVYSTNIKETNKIFNKEMLSFLNEMAKYVQTDYKILIYDNQVYLYIDRWKFNIYKDLQHEYKFNQMEDEVNAILKFYEFLNELYNKIKKIEGISNG